MQFETVNELTLKVHMQPGEKVFTKAGAYIGGQSFGGKNYQFEKILLGVEGNPVQAALHQVMRRVTGENLPLMQVKSSGENITYYANEAQHVTVVQLNQGERISVESENILAFTSDCKYNVRFLAQGVISQKGLATSTLTGVGPQAYVAILTDGNPIVLNNNDGSVLTADPDAVVCWVDSDPAFKLDLSWKNLIGQASGESYFFQWNNNATVIVQPNERKSGLDISMDGKRTGSQPTRQNNQSLGGAVNQAGNTMNQAGNMMNNLGGMMGGNGTNMGGNQTGQMGQNGQPGLGNIINNLFNS